MTRKAPPPPEREVRSLAVVRCPVCGYEIEQYGETIAAWCQACNGRPMEVQEVTRWVGAQTLEGRRFIRVGGKLVGAEAAPMKGKVGVGYEKWIK